MLTVQHIYAKLFRKSLVYCQHARKYKDYEKVWGVSDATILAQGASGQLHMSLLENVLPLRGKNVSFHR